MRGCRHSAPSTNTADGTPGRRRRQLLRRLRSRPSAILSSPRRCASMLRCGRLLTSRDRVPGSVTAAVPGTKRKMPRTMLSAAVLGAVMAEAAGFVALGRVVPGAQRAGGLPLPRRGAARLSPCPPAGQPRRVRPGRWRAQKQGPTAERIDMEGDDVAAVERRVAVEADGAAAVGGRAAVEDRGASLERGMQQVLGASGIFMFLWVFVLFPGSAYTGFQGHDAWIDWLFETFPLFGLIAPVSLITKYNELGHLPAFTHAVPGAVWSILAPLQVPSVPTEPPNPGPYALHPTPETLNLHASSCTRTSQHGVRTHAHTSDVQAREHWHWCCFEQAVAVSSCYRNCASAWAQARTRRRDGLC